MPAEEFARCAPPNRRSITGTSAFPGFFPISSSRKSIQDDWIDSDACAQVRQYFTAMPYHAKQLSTTHEGSKQLLVPPPPLTLACLPGLPGDAPRGSKLQPGKGNGVSTPNYNSAYSKSRR
jgi:hypothetical protein